MSRSFVAEALRLSMAVLVPLAVVRFVVPGPSVSGLTVFPFLVYLVGIHVPLFVVYLHRRDTAAVTLPAPLAYLFLFLGSVAVSVVWAVDKTAAFKHLTLLVSSGGISVLAFWGSEDRSDMDPYFGALVVLTLAGLTLSAWEFWTGMHLPVSVQHGGAADHVSTAWYPNENDFSFFLAFVVPIFAVRSLSRVSVPNRTFDLALTAAALAVIWLNGARGAVVAVAVALGAVALTIRLRRLNAGTVSQVAQLHLITMGLFLTAAVAVLAVALLSNPFSPVLGEKSTWIRWQLQHGSVILLFKNGLGVGPGNFPLRFHRLAIPPDRAIAAHNWLATLFAEYGFPGTIAFLFLLGSLLDGLITEYFETGDAYSLALFGSLLTFPISGLGPNDVLTMPILWVMFALALGNVYLGSPADGADS